MAEVIHDGLSSRPDLDVPRQCKREDGDLWAWKVRYADRESAASANKGLEPYPCYFCGFWHLGHAPAKTWALTVRLPWGRTA